MTSKKINIDNIDGVCIAEIKSNNTEISSVQDALDIMASCDYQGSKKIIIQEKNIASCFFHLKTGLAGEILQKFSTYRVQLAIVGDFSKYASKSLRNFIYESNKYGQVIFVSSTNEAKERLLKQ